MRVYGTNPYSAGLSSPSENVLKITVKDRYIYMPDVPLSVVDKEVFKLLNDYNVSFSKKKIGISIPEK